MSPTGVGAARTATAATTTTAATRPGVPTRPASPARPVPPRLTVVPPLRASAPRAPFVILLCALLVAGLGGLLYLHTTLAENSFHLHDLQVRSERLTDQEQALERAIAQSAAPRRLASRARELGMVRSENPAFIRLSDGRILGKPRPGKARPLPVATVVPAVPAAPAVPAGPGSGAGGPDAGAAGDAAAEGAAAAEGTAAGGGAAAGDAGSPTTSPSPAPSGRGR